MEGDPVRQQRTPLMTLLLRLVALPLSFGLASSLVIVTVQWAQTDQARWFYLGLDGMQSYLIIGLVSLLLIAGCLVVFRPKFRTVALIGAGILGPALGILNCVRIESFRGDRTPRFVWKWTPTAEEEVRSYLASHRERMAPKPVLPWELISPTGSDFPGFMGPDRNGRLVGVNLSKRWDKRPPRLLWKHPVGLGWSSFAVQGSVAVTMEQREELECTVCYDLRRGEELWVHSETVRFRNEHGDGPRTTPCIQTDRVIACGGTGVVVCLDLASGGLLWKTELMNDEATTPPYFGWSCSPMVCGSEVIVTPGIQPGGTMVALDLETGLERWRGGDDATSYASPIAATLCGELQFLSFNGEGLRAFTRGGASRWFFPWVTQGESRVNVAQPVLISRGDASSGEPARVLISSGYDMGTALVEIRNENGHWNANPVWKSKHLKAKLSNFVVHRDHIFGLDNGLLTCLRLSDGQRTWKQGRYGHGQLLLVDNRLLIQCESGEVAMVEANPETHVELARFEALSDKTWNHPALAGNILVVRNDREAAAYELPTILRID